MNVTASLLAALSGFVAGTLLVAAHERPGAVLARVIEKGAAFSGEAWP